MLQPKDTGLLNGYKNKTHIYAVYKRPTSDLGTHTDKVRGWKKIFHANGNQKKAGVAILISGEIDLKIKNVTIDKEGHYIMIRGSIQEEDITIINTYAPNIGAPQYIRQLLAALKEEIDSNTVIVGDLNTSLTPMNRSSKQKIKKETQALNDTIDQVHLIDIYRTFHPKTADYIFFSSANGTLSRITSWFTNQALVNFRKLISYQVSFPTTTL